MKEISFSTFQLNTDYDSNLFVDIENISGYTPVFLVNVRSNSPGVSLEYFGVNQATNQAYIRVLRTAGDQSSNFTPQATVVYFKDTMNYK